MNASFESFWSAEKPERPFVVAGPCSAETEDQVLETAHALADSGLHLFRAGLWKPRTHPDSFEGVGKAGLAWLRRARQETGLAVTTEVANAAHVYEALKYGLDVLWIGARTTVNPFAVQDIADALQGVDVPILVKNPINPDLKLWLGAVERLQRAGVRRLGAVHRGFSFHGRSPFRNLPRWPIAMEFRRQMPELPLLCDSSHICGRRDMLAGVAQKALDLNYDGIMMEVHPRPDEAWSDAAQQITPGHFQKLLDGLVARRASLQEVGSPQLLDHLRQEIDEIDHELFQLLGRRMQVSRQIGAFKRERNLAVLQPGRWNDVLQEALARGEHLGLSRAFVGILLKAIHQESINHQIQVLHEEESLSRAAP